MTSALVDHKRLFLGGVGILLFWGLAWIELPATLRVVLLWCLLLGVPGFLARAWLGPREGSHTLERWGIQILLGWIAILVLSVLASWFGLPLHALPWLWSTTCLMLMLGGMRRPRVSTPRTSREAILVGLVLLAGFLWVGRSAPELSVESDLAAHLGASHDALVQDRWLPLDHSVDAQESRRDPRFGLLHGLHAAVASHLGLEILTVVQRSAAFFTALFLLAHAMLFCSLGLPGGAALAASVLYAWGASGGAALGWWSSFYPSQVALGLAAQAMALCVFRIRQLPDSSDRSLYLGGIALGLSAFLHPFAWWAWGLVLLHAVVLAAFSQYRQPWLRALLRMGVPAFVVGFSALAPLLLQGGAKDGAQWEAAGILRMGESLFVVDPLVLIRFGGWLSLLGAPIFLLGSSGRWRTDPGMWLAAAAAIPVWTIALNPLLQPLVFSNVGFLSERLGQLTWVPALALLLILTPRDKGRSAFERPSRPAFLASLLLLLGVPHAIDAAISTPYDKGVSLDRLEELQRGLMAVGSSRPLLDPASTYTLRGLVGGVGLIQPIEHCSPLDAGVDRRLAGYRELLASNSQLSRLAEQLDVLGADALVLDPGIMERYRYPLHGFYPSAERQNDLARRLLMAGIHPEVVAGTVRIYPRSSLTELSDFNDVSYAHANGCDGDPEFPVRGSRIELLEMHVEQDSVSLGQDLRIRLCYRFSGGEPTWERVHLRFEGPMPSTPAWARGFSKVYRKLLVERSARSKARFSAVWAPLDGYWRSDSEEGLTEEEWRTLRIPSGLRPGAYRLQPSVRNDPWRPIRSVDDFLRDEDSLSAPVWTTIRISEQDGGS